jgi:hypothetical protein
MRSSTAEVTVVDQKRGGQTQQRFNRREDYLPAAWGRAARQERLELIPRLTDRQLEVIRKVRHAARLLLRSLA